MDPLDALARSWRDVKEPSMSELLAAQCRKCRVAHVFPMHVRAEQQRQRQSSEPATTPRPVVSAPTPTGAALDKLTEREIEVAVLTALGHTNGSAGEKLFLSEHTIKSHKARIFRKLGIQSAAQLGVLVAKAGLV